ncbi:MULTISPECIES: IclR family transcriptional regulator [unclassified Modestobacter]
MTASHDRRTATGTESGRKLLSVLLCFSGARPAWTIAEIAAELDLTASSAYRYVAQLRESGLLEAGPNSVYRVTDRVMSLAEACESGRSPLVDLALPVMTMLRDGIGETVLLARRSGDAAFCVERVESHQAVRLQFERGQAMQLHSGSMPRLLLSYMPQHERERYLERVRPMLAPDRLAMLSSEALERTARLGNSESMAEIDDGIWGCAAAIRRGHDVIAVIGTAGPAYRLDADRRADIRRMIIAGADRISEALEPPRR